VDVTDIRKESLPSDASEKTTPVFIDISQLQPLENLLQTMHENHK
jgi:hypothetical protein